MKKIKAIHSAAYEPIADLVTYRAMPTMHVPMNLLDPFILLNHHGYQQYRPHNSGLPFGPHPHRGFETVTFIYEGDLTHKDSSGAESVIKAGGVQWMTAGRGLIHAEISSEEFKKRGGPLEILQLWVNLPAEHKMTKPRYIGLQKEEIPEALWDEGKVKAQLISGNWSGSEGAFQPISDIYLSNLYFTKEGKASFSIPQGQNVLFYVARGAVAVNDEEVRNHCLVHFENEGTEIKVEGLDDEAILLFGYATPLNEPFEAHGPFVMNTREEIAQAYDAYRSGQMGNVDVL